MISAITEKSVTKVMSIKHIILQVGKCTAVVYVAAVNTNDASFFK